MTDGPAEREGQVFFPSRNFCGERVLVRKLLLLAWEPLVASDDEEEAGGEGVFAGVASDDDVAECLI